MLLKQAIILFWIVLCSRKVLTLFFLTGNTVEVNLINIDEDLHLPLNISAEEYENPSSYSADNEIAGIDNDLASDKNEEAGDDNEEAGATRPKTVSQSQAFGNTWLYIPVVVYRMQYLQESIQV